MSWKPVRHLLVGGVIGVAVTAGAPLAAVAAPAAVVAPAAQAAAATVAWAPCQQDATVECGVLRVPVDWARPDGERFDLAMARRVATDPAGRIGTLVIDPGGPGGSGVATVLNGGFDDQLRQHFDILGFDPRGVGASSPVLCSLDLLNQVSSAITSQADFDATVASGRALADDCRSRSGPVFDHLDTVQTVGDIDAIRAAVGDPQLSFFGMSYGTLMAHQYAEHFPTRVRAIVADSNMDHSLDAAGFATAEAVTDQDTFDEFAAGCARIPSCALYGQDIRQFWHRLLDRAARGELPDPDDPSYLIQPAELANYVVGALNYGPYWVGVASELQRLDEGRPSGQSTPPAQPPSGLVVNFVYQATMCQDWNLGAASYPAWRAILDGVDAAAPDLPGLSRPRVGAICLGWPTPPTNPPHRIVASNATPLLLVNSAHDPATAYQWALGTAGQFGQHAVLLTYQGWGHIVYQRTACVDDAIDRYLIDRRPPAAGTTCAAVPPEGATDASASARRAAAAAQPAGPAARQAATDRAPTLRELRGSSTLPTWQAPPR